MVKYILSCDYNNKNDDIVYITYSQYSNINDCKFVLNQSLISSKGHDTTASAISWTLFSLAENAECQKKCQAEIDELLADRDNDDIDW